MNTYIPAGICAKKITFTVENNTVHQVEFANGCPGNLQALGKLVEGMPVETVIERLKGIHCGNKTTSCADQLARALEQAASSHASAEAVDTTEGEKAASL